MTLADLVRVAQQRIAESGSETARLDAEVLLRHVLRTDRIGLFMRLNESASEGVADAFNALVDQRVAGVPVAYLTGIREFMGFAFGVSPAVLIPRPETELLVEWALGWIGQRSDLTVLDVGTGSGAIAVSLAALDTSESNAITACDVSDEALEVAKANADRLLTPFRRKRLQFVNGSLLGWRIAPVDLVLANLPYLTPSQMASNPDLAEEPALALDGGTDGLDLVRGLITDLPRVLAPRGAVGLEVDPDQVDTVMALLAEAIPEGTVEVITDLAGHRRHVVLRRNG
jgi:release factor glutamine methyltransferase